jgi:hypothetical protein
MPHSLQRRETVEPPFGTLKMRMGATHFLMKRLPRVASETALHYSPAISHAPSTLSASTRTARIAILAALNLFPKSVLTQPRPEGDTIGIFSRESADIGGRFNLLPIAVG